MLMFPNGAISKYAKVANIEPFSLHSMLCIIYYTPNTLYSVYYISYRVTGLYRLDKTCFLHGLQCK